MTTNTVRTRIVAFLFLCAGAGFAQTTSDTSDVIVRFKQSPDHIGERRFEERGARHLRSLDPIGSHVYRVDQRNLQLLETDPEVDYIAPDRAVQATSSLADVIDYGWMNVLGVTSPSGTLPYNGAGIGVAVIDSGITVNADLKDSKGNSRVVYSQSFVAGDSSTTDSYGHGTMVAGILAGNGTNSTDKTMLYQIRGIAPGVSLINLRALDRTGAGTDSSVIAAIQEAIALKSKYNIRVINLSLGRPVFESYTADPICQAVQQAWNAGIVVVVAAGNNGRDDAYGNSGYATINSPGNSPAVITVGAMNTVGTLSTADDKIASYSSKGPTLIDHIAKPDLVAPGNRIISVQATSSSLVQTYSNNRVAWSSFDSSMAASPSPNYFQLSGTSMAAPMVSGAAALLLQQNPNLTPDQVKARLMKTATKLPLVSTTATDPTTGVAYTSENDIFTVGAGYLNVPAALANSDLARLPATSPVTAFNGTSNSVEILCATSAAWGSSAAWGTSVVWGANTVAGSSAAWGTSAAWGSGGLWGESAAWGTGAPWGTSAAWGSSAAWGTGTIWGSAAVASSGTIQTTAITVAINGEN